MTEIHTLVRRDMDPVLKILNDHIGRFIRMHPMVFIGIIVATTWLPLIFPILRGEMLEPMIDIYIMKFEYANIPVGFTVMYVVFLLIYFFYIKPYDKKFYDDLNKANREALEKAYGRHRSRLNTFWDDKK